MKCKKLFSVVGISVLFVCVISLFSACSVKVGIIGVWQDKDDSEFFLAFSQGGDFYAAKKVNGSLKKMAGTYSVSGKEVTINLGALSHKVNAEIKMNELKGSFLGEEKTFKRTIAVPLKDIQQASAASIL